MSLRWEGGRQDPRGRHDGGEQGPSPVLGLLITVLALVVLVVLLVQGHRAPAPTTPPRARASSVAPQPTASAAAVRLRQLARDPAAHGGERMVVYGVVDRFDDHLGQGRMWAHVGASPDDPDAIVCLLDSTPQALLPVQPGDRFVAAGVVEGAVRYPVPPDQAVRVPHLRADLVKVLESAP